MGRHLIDLTGKVFGRLSVLQLVAKELKHPYWLCKCVCGKESIVRGSHLKDGTISSCGCLNEEVRISCKTTHGMYYTPTYQTWHSMLGRCYQESNASYKNYGAKGITICDRWHKFENFFEDMGVRPEEKTLDRRDATKGYYPENCRWATRKEQQEFLKGCKLPDEKKNLLASMIAKGLPKTVMAKELGVDRGTIYRYIKCFSGQYPAGV